MQSATYLSRREQLATYFDQTAVEAWSRLTSNVPVSGIRATVRAGREHMRSMLLDWLPGDLRGSRVLDAGCGTGALAAVLAQRGADVMAVDLSPRLVQLARERIPANAAGGRIEFRVGDMTDSSLGMFDHVVAMDSLIHYAAPDMARVVMALAQRAKSSVLFTFAPRTAALSLMHAIGRLFPRADRAPLIEPVTEGAIRRLLLAEAPLGGFRHGRSCRVATTFYVSQAFELVRG